MAGVGQRGAVAQDGETDDPSALRIDTEVFATLTESASDDGDGAPVVVRWFDCWRS